jgi:hypothetical protein
MIDLATFDNEAIRRGVAELVKLMRTHGDPAETVEEFHEVATEAAYALDEEADVDGNLDLSMNDLIDEVIERAAAGAK